MQSSPSKTSSAPFKPTAGGFVDYLGFVFPKANLPARVAFAVKVFVTHDPPPFDAASLLDCIQSCGLGLYLRFPAAERLRDVKATPLDDTAVRDTLYFITTLGMGETEKALRDVAEMERQVHDDPTLIPLAMLRQMFYGVVGGQNKWESLTKDLSDSLGRLASSVQPVKVDVSLDTSKIKSAQDTKPAEKLTVVPITPSPANTNITFDGKGIPKIEPKTRAKPTAEPAKVEPKGHEYTEASVRETVEKRHEDCALAIRNMLLVQEGRARMGLSAVHDKMTALGYDKPTILAAIDGMTYRGELYMEGHALVPSTMLPSTLGGWGATIIDLNREKGWYDEEQLSEKAARALAKLSADEQAELLKHMPLIPHREPKGRIDVAAFCTNLTGEISELWEAYRKSELDKPCDKAAKMKALGLPELTCAEEEMADIIIRTLDTAEFWGIDISRAVKVKHLYNDSREYRHGNKAA